MNIFKKVFLPRQEVFPRVHTHTQRHQKKVEGERQSAQFCNFKPHLHLRKGREDMLSALRVFTLSASRAISRASVRCDFLRRHLTDIMHDKERADESIWIARMKKIQMAEQVEKASNPDERDRKLYDFQQLLNAEKRKNEK